jgi:type II secretion system protein J
MRRARGFSLLELLVALGVLALVATLGWRGLGSVLESQARIQSEMRRWDDLQRVMQQLGRDLSLAVGRPMQDAAGGLFITRFGDPDAAAAQSGVRRVGYRLRDGALEYMTEQTSTTYASTALADVGAFELRVLGADGQWRPMRREPLPADAPPRALAAEIVLASGERIRRVFVLP